MIARVPRQQKYRRDSEQHRSIEKWWNLGEQRTEQLKVSSLPAQFAQLQLERRRRKHGGNKTDSQPQPAEEAQGASSVGDAVAAQRAHALLLQQKRHLAEGKVLMILTDSREGRNSLHQLFDCSSYSRARAVPALRRASLTFLRDARASYSDKIWSLPLTILNPITNLFLSVYQTTRIEFSLLMFPSAP